MRYDINTNTMNTITDTPIRTLITPYHNTLHFIDSQLIKEYTLWHINWGGGGGDSGTSTVSA